MAKKAKKITRKKKSKTASVEWEKFLEFVQGALKRGDKITTVIVDKYGCVTTAKFRWETKPEKKKRDKGLVKIPCLVMPRSPFWPKKKKSPGKRRLKK